MESIIMYVKQKRLKNYYYKFFNDKLVYYNAGLKKKEKQLEYTEFKQISINQGLIQSRFGIGDIYIKTNNKNIIKSLVIIKDIPDVKENYERIVKLFNT